MKAKNQLNYTSELDAKEKLIVYVYEYLVHSGAKQAAEAFTDNIGYTKDIKVNDSPGFLFNWWCVFWDLYCASPDRVHQQPEPSHEARVFHENNMRSLVSPSSCSSTNTICVQTSPTQQNPHLMVPSTMPINYGPRQYAPYMGYLRGSPIALGSRMYNIWPGGLPINMSVPNIQHASSMMNTSVGPRYHGPQQVSMGPISGSSRAPNIGLEPGPSPGLNRITPAHVSSPHSQGVPANNVSPMLGPSMQMVSHASGQQPVLLRPGVRIQAQAWPSNFNINSPTDQQCFMPSGTPNSHQQQQQHQQQQDDFGILDENGLLNDKQDSSRDDSSCQTQDEYMMPNAYGQQNDSADTESEILKLKETLENNSKGFNDGDQTGFELEFPEDQNKW